MMKTRLAAVDALRGGAIVLMVIYHFCFDLDLFGRIDADFNNDPFWLTFRAVIVSLFLGLVGISLQLAARGGLDRRRYLRRLGWLLVCALLVSAGSYVMFPRSLIFFGILHFIFVASLLGLLFLRGYWLNASLGVVLILVGVFYQSRVFDHPALQWLGMMTHKPVTEDYVPLLPWFGVVLLGQFIAVTVFRAGLDARLGWQPRGPAGRGLLLAGRHSLLIYMLHQPLLIGTLYLLFANPLR